MSYSVGVQNIFELLEDENDDQPDVKTLQTKLEETPNKKSANRQAPVGDSKPRAAQRDGSNAPIKNQPKEPKMEGFTDVTSQKGRSPSTRKDGDRPRRDGDNRGPRREGGDYRGPREDRPPRRDGDQTRPPKGDRPPREARPPREGNEERTREPRPPREGREPRDNRGPREDRPPREGRGEDRGPREGQPRGDRDKDKWIRENQNAPYDGQHNKRTYDRRSGTGRGPQENKKGGHGGANWGSETDPKEELAAEEQVKEDVATDAKEGGEVPAEGAVEGETPASPVVPEKKELSLAEYRKQREAALNALPTLPEARQAGEGVTDKEREKWATEALSTKAQEEAKTAKESGQKKEEAAKKPSLDQFFHIKPRERPKYDEDRPRREDRGDRGDRPPRRDRDDRPRRDGSKGGNKGGNNNKAAAQSGQSTEPIAKTDTDFPTLNTKA